MLTSHSETVCTHHSKLSELCDRGSFSSLSLFLSILQRISSRVRLFPAAVSLLKFSKMLKSSNLLSIFARIFRFPMIENLFLAIDFEVLKSKILSDSLQNDLPWNTNTKIYDDLSYIMGIRVFAMRRGLPIEHVKPHIAQFDRTKFWIPCICCVSFCLWV